MARSAAYGFSHSHKAAWLCAVACRFAESATEWRERESARSARMRAAQLHTHMRLHGAFPRRCCSYGPTWRTQGTRSHGVRLDSKLCFLGVWVVCGVGVRSDCYRQATCSPAGRRHYELCFLVGWCFCVWCGGGRREGNAQDSNCVPSRGGGLERPDLTKEECTGNFFFSVGGVSVIGQESIDTWGKPTGRDIRVYSTRGVTRV